MKIVFAWAFSAAMLFNGLALANNGTGYVNVEQLNKKLEKTHAQWTARDNWVNNQSKSEIQHMMGLRTAPKAGVQFQAPASLRIQQALPDGMDWRNYKGQNWVSPMLNQGNCGSCVAFASVAVLETQVNISSMISNLNRRFSPQFLFSCGGGICNFGWEPDSAADFLQQTGTPDEACLPYSSGATSQDVSCSTACSNVASRTQKISNYTTPTRYMRNIDAVKQALLHGPLVTTFSVYADFMAYSSGVYKRTSNELMGGHAVSIVGYDDSTQSWIIRNNWGEEWGEKGFAHVAYDDDSGIGDETWAYDIPALDGYVSTVFPRDYSFLAGAAEFKGNSNFATTTGLKFHVTDSNQHDVMTQTCATNSQCSVNFDTMTWKDGRYEVETSAVNASGTALSTSPRQFFYVANSKPQMSLSFSGANKTDISQPLKGRPEFVINASSSSVPFSSLEFHIKNLANGSVDTRKSEVVVNGMTVGWRTNMGPNGSYELWMVGHVKTNAQDYVIESAHQTVQVQN